MARCALAILAVLLLADVAASLYLRRSTPKKQKLAVTTPSSNKNFHLAMKAGNCPPADPKRVELAMKNFQANLAKGGNWKERMVKMWKNTQKSLKDPDTQALAKKEFELAEKAKFSDITLKKKFDKAETETLVRKEFARLWSTKSDKAGPPDGGKKANEEDKGQKPAKPKKDAEEAMESGSKEEVAKVMDNDNVPDEGEKAEHQGDETKMAMPSAEELASLGKKEYCKKPMTEDHKKEVDKVVNEADEDVMCECVFSEITHACYASAIKPCVEKQPVGFSVEQAMGNCQNDPAVKCCAEQQEAQTVKDCADMLKGTNGEGEPGPGEEGIPDPEACTAMLEQEMQCDAEDTTSEAYQDCACSAHEVVTECYAPFHECMSKKEMDEEDAKAKIDNCYQQEVVPVLKQKELSIVTKCATGREISTGCIAEATRCDDETKDPCLTHCQAYPMCTCMAGHVGNDCKSVMETCTEKHNEGGDPDAPEGTSAMNCAQDGGALEQCVLQYQQPALINEVVHKCLGEPHMMDCITKNENCAKAR